METSPRGTRQRPSPSLSPSSWPATSDVNHLLSRHRGQVTSIRAFPHRRSTMLIIRCRLPHPGIRVPAQPMSTTTQPPPKTRHRIPLNDVRTPRRQSGSGHCCQPATKKTTKYSRRCSSSSSSSTKWNSKRRSKLLSRHALRSRTWRQFQLKLVTVFLKYHRQMKKRRRRNSEQWTYLSESEQEGAGQVEGGSEGVFSPASQDSGFCESEELEDPDKPVIRWSPSEDEHIFVSHSEEDDSLANTLMQKIESGGFRCFSPEQDSKAGPLVQPIESALESSRRIVLLLTCNYLQSHWCSFQLQMSVYFMYYSNRALIVPVIVDLKEEEVPPCLRNMSLVYMRSDPNYQEKLMSILKGPEISVKELMPFGNVSHGLVWAYYLRYLKIILPGLSKRIRRWSKKETCLDVRMPRKLYILVPDSCYCPDKLKSNDGRIEFEGRLDPVRRDSAGSVDRSYDLSVWNLRKKDGQIMQFVGEYAAIIDTLYLMDSRRSAGLSSQLRGRARDHFVHTLKRVLEADGLKRWAQVVEFHDTDEEGQEKPLSDILTPYVERDRLWPPIQTSPGPKPQGSSHAS